MTFQGPLPPVIASKVHSASQPTFGGLHRSDNVERLNPNVLDSYSASINVVLFGIKLDIH